jgi:DNA-binding FadR family transcriptional regulator
MSPVQKKRAAEETADRLRDAILGGQYRAGADLPGERELARSLGVSRLTLRAALARLEAEGLVRPVHGSGNRVLDFRETGGIDLMGHLAVIAQSGREVPLSILANLLELRRSLAVEAIGLAAERATTEEIYELRAHIERQASLVDDRAAYVRADLKLARLLAGASHNIALVLLANTIVRLLEKHPGIQPAFFVDQQASLNVYRKFVKVIESRDQGLARTFARRLITRHDRKLLASIGALFDGENSKGE